VQITIELNNQQFKHCDYEPQGDCWWMCVVCRWPAGMNINQQRNMPICALGECDGLRSTVANNSTRQYN